MALGLDFLKKTAMGAQQAGGAQKAQQAGGAQQANPANNTSVSNALAGGDKAQGAQQADLTKMSTSDLMKHVYGNNAGQNAEAEQSAGKQEKSGNEKPYILPATVEYNNQKFPSQGQDLDKVVDEIVKQTGDSKSKVETELKKKYANPAAIKAGGQLDMNA